MNDTAEQMAKCREWIHRSLVAESLHRNRHDDWEAREREAVTIAANEWAAFKGLPTRITTDDVLRVEGSAVGHIDYSTKLALYVTELVYGVRQVA